MSQIHERNQTFIDGGLFSMSLVYSLTFNNVATCILNTNFSLKQENEIKSILNINEFEDLILFIAIGSFPNITKSPISLRDDIYEFTEII